MSTARDTLDALLQQVRALQGDADSAATSSSAFQSAFQQGRAMALGDVVLLIEEMRARLSDA